MTNSSIITMIKLSDLVSIHSGKKASLSETGETPYLDIDSLDKDIQKYYAVDGVTDVSADDIIIVADGYRSGMVMKGKKGRLGSTMKSLRLLPNAQITSSFLYYYLSYITLNRMQFLSGSTVRHLNMAMVKEIKVPILSLQTQNDICSEIDSYDKIIDRIKKNIFKIENILKDVEYKEKKTIVGSNKSIMTTIDTIWSQVLTKHFSKL